jgi:protein TonB
VGKSILKRTLDDIAFEGRNKDYGAYLIRKTYPLRLVRSFFYSMAVFITVLFFFELIRPANNDYYFYNPNSGIQRIGVTISENLFPPGSSKASSSSAEQNSAPTIVDDNTVPAMDESNKAVPETGDSSATKGGDAGTAGSGNGGNADGGMQGEVFASAEVNPQFEGGIRAMQDFIRTNLEYPETARSQSIAGVIHVFFIVRSNGTLSDVKIVKGLHSDLDKEVIRVVKSMPLWRPGLQGGVPVNVMLKLPITVSPIK